MSIQDFLISQGFAVNALEETFTKWQSGWKRVEIPFPALAGHTLESFQRMAKDKGWIDAAASADYFDEPLLASGAVFPCQIV